MNELGARVRLVKGAQEPASVAHSARLMNASSG
jgi:hypothetical protein